MNNKKIKYRRTKNMLIHFTQGSEPMSSCLARLSILLRITRHDTLSISFTEGTSHKKTSTKHSSIERNLKN